MLLDTQLKVNSTLQLQHLFDPDSKEDYQDYVAKTLKQITSFLGNDKFYSGATPADLRNNEYLKIGNSQRPIAIDEALSQVKSLYLDNAISFHNKNYVAHLNCPVLLPALVGDMIASSVNTAVETWDQSTSATLIEQEVTNWICEVMGLPSSSDGIFTSGGTQSNFMALLMARDHYAFKHYGLNIKQNGWSDVVSKFRIFCSEKAHFSMKKNAALLGMGYDAVIAVATDDKMKMEPGALVLAIEKEKQKGNIPIAVVATAGTTDYGSFDPLKIIGTIAQEANIWFHVDGAYGGCYALTNSHKDKLSGIELADSITIDFHKTLFQPVCSSAFLARDKTNFRYVSYYADYLNPLEDRDEEYPNLIEKSIQTTRRFDALKLWFTIKMVGTETLSSYLEKVHFLAVDLYNSIKDDSNFELIHEPELSTLVFRYTAEGITDNKIHDTINLYIKNTLFKSGQASIASTKFDNKTYLKFTLLNPRSTLKDLLNIIEMIKQKGKEYKTTN